MILLKDHFEKNIQIDTDMHDKKLNVELPDFSIETAKMVILAGGTVKRV